MYNILSFLDTDTTMKMMMTTMADVIITVAVTLMKTVTRQIVTRMIMMMDITRKRVTRMTTMRMRNIMRTKRARTIMSGGSRLEKILALMNICEYLPFLCETALAEVYSNCCTSISLLTQIYPVSIFLHISKIFEEAQKKCGWTSVHNQVQNKCT